MRERNAKILTVRKAAREYGESSDGYWNSKKFMKLMEKAAEAKFPKDKGYRLYWIFDHSSCHTAYADDSLNASKMNAKPGGCHTVMHDTLWNGKMTKSVLVHGHRTVVPKGLIEVLTERGMLSTKDES